MTHAQAALLADLIDYAGLFPPSSIGLPQAVAAYLQHGDDPAAAMLARFIVPASQLDALVPWLDGSFSPERPWRLSVLATMEDLPSVGAFAARRPAARIESIETRVPASVVATGSVSTIRAHLAGLVAAATRAGLGGRACWCESAAEASDDPDTPVVHALADPGLHGGGLRLGYKLRCGGVTAGAVPAVGRVARVLAAVAAHRVPLKCTAGLHHPVRGMGQTEDVPMHGFLNVIGGGAFAHTGLSDAATLAEIVAETDTRAFGLDGAGLRWRDLTVAPEDLRRLRRDLLAGFGSCSFAEPRDELRALGLLNDSSTGARA